MSAWIRIGLVSTALALTACGSSPKPAYYTLADGERPSVPAKRGVSVAVMAASLPELYDRPQLVIGQPGGRVQILDQQRWAEPLRQEIARAVAADLGRKLDSNGVVALPEDVQALAPDYRLMLDVQQIAASPDVGVSVDVAWRLVARDGKVRHGRSAHSEPAAVAGTAPYAGLATAYRRVFGRVAEDVAAGVTDFPAMAR